MGEHTAKEPIVNNLYDGAGNEMKVVTTENSSGRRVQSTGDTVDEAMKDVDKTSPIGEGFGDH